MKLVKIRLIGLLVFLPLLTLGLGGCMAVNTAMIPGQTRTDFTLKHDTYKQIRICEWGCAGTKYGNGAIKYQDPDIVDTTIVELPVIFGGSWKENWKVARSGGVTAIYTVTYIPSPQGGIDIHIKFPPEILP
jgi:hypothetical protein